MAKKRHEEHIEEEPENNERWMLTYADLITLLLALFILLFSMSKIDASKYAALAQSMQNVFNGSPGKSIIEKGTGNGEVVNNFPSDKVSTTISSSNSTNKTDANGAANAAKIESQKMDKVAKDIQDYVNRKGLAKQINVNSEEKGVVIRIMDSYFFASGDATITPQTRQKIISIGSYLKGLGNVIRIEGYTDNVPISNSNYKSNWDLSFWRALNVLYVFQNDLKFDPSKLKPQAGAEYDPVYPKNANEYQRSQNRRVEIVVLRSKYGALE